MADKKDTQNPEQTESTESQHNEPEEQSRRSFLKTTGIGLAMAAGPAAFFGKILEAKAAIAGERNILNSAIWKVEANARKGRTRELSIAKQYRLLGGTSKDVIRALTIVDSKLKKANAFKEFNKDRIDRTVEQAISEFAQGSPGMAKGKSNLFSVPDSAAREMFDRGGVTLKKTLDRMNEKVPGFNAPSVQLKTLKLRQQIRR